MLNPRLHGLILIVCVLYIFHMPWDQVDSSTGCAGRKEFQREPAISGFNSSAHLLTQPVRPVCVQHRRGTPGTLLGAISTAVAGPAWVALACLPTTVPTLNLVHHDRQIILKKKKTQMMYPTLLNSFEWHNRGLCTKSSPAPTIHATWPLHKKSKLSAFCIAKAGYVITFYTFTLVLFTDISITHVKSMVVDTDHMVLKSILNYMRHEPLH